MKKSFFISLFVLLFLLSAPAYSGQIRYDYSSTDEIEIGAGIFPLSSYHIYKDFKDGSSLFPDSYSEGLVLFPQVSVSYQHNLGRLFALSGSFTYANAYYHVRDLFTEAVMGRSEASSYTLMVYARFYWLNRKSVRLFSAVGAGASYTAESVFDPVSKTNGHVGKFRLAPDVRLAGIVFGSDVYGFASVGVGTYGLLNLGLGFRF